MSRPTYWPVVRFVASYWLRCPRLLGSLVTMRLGASVFDVLVPLASAAIVDATAAAGPLDLSRALWSLALFIALIAGFQTLRHIVGLLLNELSIRSMEALVRDAFAKVQRLSADWHANAFAGATVRKITRGMWAYDVFTDTVVYNLAPALIVVGGVTLTLVLRWPSLGCALAIGVASYLVLSIALAMRWVGPASQRSQVEDSRLSATIADALTANAVVKGFAAEEREDHAFAKIVRSWRELSVLAWNRGIYAAYLQAIVLMALQAGVIGIGVWLWSRGQASPGDIAGLVAGQLLIGGYLRDIGQHVRNAQRAINEMEDVVAFAALDAGVADKPGAAALTVRRGGIVFDQVTFGYAGAGAPLYDRFCLQIRPGERVGLVGASGAGKSTFVKLLQRLYDLESGRILIDGQDIAAVTQASLRSAIGLVAQEPILFHRSLADNIAYGCPNAAPERIAEAARLAHAHGFIERLPEAYRTLVGERGIKLSGGERQRVAIARAILAGTPILILDEATSSLDSVSERLIRDAIEQLSAGRTTIVVAHRLSTVQRLDRILVFERGRIVEEGSHAELIQRPDGHYRRLFETQGGIEHDGAAVDKAA